MESKNTWGIFVVIIIVILALGGAYYYGGKNGDTASTTPTTSGSDFAAKFRAVDSSDHVRGDINAPVKLVVYSDLECPACKIFHQELLKLNDNYVKDGKVAIVFRPLPLLSLHPKSQKENEAGLCVNELGGNDKYWSFIDKVFEITPSNNGLDEAKLPEIAKGLGLDVKSFSDCLASGKYTDAVKKGIDEGFNLGIQGTPSFVMVGPNNNFLMLPDQQGQTSAVVTGAYPADQLKQMIDSLTAPAPTEATTTDTTATTSVQ
ncbi:MAG: DsbA family protein [Candidatus Vogelbacteria bacterium]|nr:DsbA family protein [Candidatus Vogelbacteria bacterium]